MIKIFLYNAGKGDCIRLNYENHNIIVDSGVTGFGPRFETICNELMARGETLDLLIITHMDEDHLGGALYLARGKGVFPFEQVIMNGFISNARNVSLSTRQNSELYKLLLDKKIPVIHAKKSDTHTIDGATIKILWPTEEMIGAVYRERHSTPLAHRSDYRQSLRELSNTPIIRQDSSQSNRASIIFSFEYEGKRLLFTGDAWSSDIISSVGDGYYDAIKLPHHGSAANISDEWSSLQCKRFLICTDGIAHPDKQTIAKLQKWNEKATFYSSSDWWSKGFLLSEENASCFVKIDGQHIEI